MRYIYVFGIWIAIFAQGVTRPWLLSGISEGRIYTPWYSKGWNNIACRTILTISKEIKKIYSSITKKCEAEPYFCCPSFLCTRIGSCYTRIVSYYTRVVSCCLVLFYVVSCCLVLCRVVLVLCRVASCWLVLLLV